MILNYRKYFGYMLFVEGIINSSASGFVANLIVAFIIVIGAILLSLEKE